jgi:hypothetical protein
VFSGAVTGGTVLVWGDLELTISEAAGIATVDLSGSSAAIPAGSVYAVSIESGGYPKVYSDGEYRADGDAVVSFGALTTDPVIGNIV